MIFNFTYIPVSIGIVLLHKSPNLKSFLNYICMMSLLLYLYMQFYPLVSYLIPMVFYLSEVLLLLFYYVNTFCMKLEFFFMTIENGLGDIFSMNMLTRLRQKNEEQLQLRLEAHVNRIEKKRAA